MVRESENNVLHGSKYIFVMVIIHVINVIINYLLAKGSEEPSGAHVPVKPHTDLFQWQW